MSDITKQFASDNYSGMCPEALEYLLNANRDHEMSYGDDTWTAKVSDKLRELFEIDCEVFFVFNGTAANSLAIGSLCCSFNSVICHENAHIETDECGAPEFFTHGSKLLLGKGENGKLSPEVIEQLVTKRDDLHFPKPKVISITQATELGTVYTKDELLAIHEIAAKHSLRIHMDGARFANAVVSLNVSPREITGECGIDVLCFGGSKNGIAMGETVLFFNKQYAEDFEYRCKQAGQLASKMRFIAAPWLGMLDSGAWLRNASHANKHAEILENKLREIPEITILFPREVNSVFVQIPESVIENLHNKGWHFYTFIELDIVRFMCSWDTTEEEIENFISDIKKAVFECKS